MQIKKRTKCSRAIQSLSFKDAFIIAVNSQKCKIFLGRCQFVLKTNLDCQTSSLSDEEFGKLIRKVFKYVKGESTGLLDEKLELVFGFIKADIDKNLAKYEETCRKRKAAADARWQNNNNASVCNSMQNKWNDNNTWKQH